MFWILIVLMQEISTIKVQIVEGVQGEAIRTESFLTYQERNWGDALSNRSHHNKHKKQNKPSCTTPDVWNAISTEQGEAPQDGNYSIKTLNLSKFKHAKFWLIAMVQHKGLLIYTHNRCPKCSQLLPDWSIEKLMIVCLSVWRPAKFQASFDHTKELKRRLMQRIEKRCKGWMMRRGELVDWNI